MYTRRIDKIEMLGSYTPDYWDSFSSLTSLLDSYLGIDNCRSMEALKLYNVTSLKDHDGARLWRCDECGNPINGQLILFNERGKIDRYEPIVRNLYPYYDCQYQLGEAFFGGHLLGDTTRPLAIVEDEISALLGSQIEKRFLWLATGHGVNLTAGLLAQLMGYPVNLFPDDLAHEFWQGLAQDFPNVVCSPIFTEININKYFKDMELQHLNNT